MWADRDTHRHRMRWSLVVLRRIRGVRHHELVAGRRAECGRDRRGRRGRDTRSGRSLAEALQRVSVFIHDEGGGGADAVAVLPASHELSDGSAGGVLHGDAFRISSFTECCLLAIGEAECHGHATNGISSIPHQRRPRPPRRSSQRRRPTRRRRHRRPDTVAIGSCTWPPAPRADWYPGRCRETGPVRPVREEQSDVSNGNA